jgi:hypothetical protein
MITQRAERARIVVLRTGVLKEKKDSQSTNAGCGGAAPDNSDHRWVMIVIEKLTLTVVHLAWDLHRFNAPRVQEMRTRTCTLYR